MIVYYYFFMAVLLFVTVFFAENGLQLMFNFFNFFY